MKKQNAKTDSVMGIVSVQQVNEANAKLKKVNAGQMNGKSTFVETPIGKIEVETNPQIAKTVKAIAKLKKVVAAVNAGQMSEEVLSPKQKEIVKVVNELTGATPVAVTTKRKLPSKKELKAAQKAETAIPMTHDEEIDALVNELNAEPLKPKRRAPKGEILPEAKEPINEKTGKPWAKFGAHGTNHVLEGFETGEKVIFNLKGIQTEGVYSHFHKNNHSPKGYLVIKVGNKIFERVLEKVTKVAPVAVAEKPSKADKKVDTKEVMAGIIAASVERAKKTAAKKKATV